MSPNPEKTPKTWDDFYPEEAWLEKLGVSRELRIAELRHALLVPDLPDEEIADIEAELDFFDFP